MHRTADPSLYARLQRELEAAGAPVEPSEAHGVLCGLLCSGSAEALEPWMNELFAGAAAGDPAVDDCKSALRKLHRDTLADMDDPGLGFSLLLSDEQQGVRERTGALSRWCEGFLYGLGIAGIATDRGLSPETREALRDFSEITRVDLAAVSDSESDEESLTELTEFLWVAVMLIREELAQT